MIFIQNSEIPCSEFSRVDLLVGKKIIIENPSGWIVTGDPRGDIEKDALKYLEENSVDKKKIGGVQIYCWN